MLVGPTLSLISPDDIPQNVVARRQSRQTTFYKLWSLHPQGTTNPLPAGTVTIPADARGAFHLPPATDTPPNLTVGCQTPNDIADTPIEGTTNPLPADAVTIPASARGAFHLPPAREKRDIRYQPTGSPNSFSIGTRASK